MIYEYMLCTRIVSESPVLDEPGWTLVRHQWHADRVDYWFRRPQVSVPTMSAGWTDTSFDFDDEPTQPGLGPVQIGSWYGPQPTRTYQAGEQLNRPCSKCKSTRVVVAIPPDTQEHLAFCKLCGHSEKL